MSQAQPALPAEERSAGLSPVGSCNSDSFAAGTAFLRTDALIFRVITHGVEAIN